MTDENVADIEKKFFFNQHIFDETVEIDDEPPAPVFSEDELAAEKAKSFKDGHTQATQEAQDSHSRHLTLVADAILKDMSTLFAQEGEREKAYQNEAVHLTLSALEKLFPYYAQSHGFEELKNTLENVIESQSAQKSVQILVHPEMIEDVNTFVDKLRSQNSTLLLEVSDDGTLGKDACRLSWKDGGALYDPESMTQEILGILKDGLAGAGAGRHDGVEAENSEASEADTNAALDNPDESPDNSAPEEKTDE